MPSYIPTISSELSIQKALQFVGDDGMYQKKRLTLIAVMVGSLAILTARMALENRTVILLFLIASGAGQIICPINMSVRTNSMGVMFSSLLIMGLFPIGEVSRVISLMALGFFSRGIFVSGLIYLNEIGGDRFRNRSLLVIFGLWALSTFFNSFDSMFGFNKWQVYYFCVFIPGLIAGFMMTNAWQPSPLYLYFKKMYRETKLVLNSMAIENERPMLPYELEGQQTQGEYIYRRIVYKDVLEKQYLKKITIPLAIIWIYREYIYYSSTMMIPEAGDQHSKIYLFVSLCQAAAVLLSYPIGKKVKRVNSIAVTVLLVLVMSLFSSFSRVPQQCIGTMCFMKTVYFMSLMIIRFSMSLLTLILINYTLEVYPSNCRRIGFSICLAVSSFGSVCMPWINSTLITLGLSGFISFSVWSAAVLFAIPKLQETYGVMKTDTLQQVENQRTEALRNWARLDFQ